MNKYKSIREKTGLTQKEFAEKFGLNFRSVQHWEGGRRPSRYVRVIYKNIEKREK